MDHPNLHFDDALPRLVKLSVEMLGRERLDSLLFFRNVEGQVGLCILGELAPDQAETIRTQLATELGPWAFEEGTPVTEADYAFTHLTESAPARWEVIEIVEDDFVTVKLADRRIVGQDWVTAPLPATTELPRRLVFWSVKGGGGRTTALCVLAAALAHEGKNVLVIDADLEAPGLGTMLLEDEHLPRYGLLDYLAEAGIVEWSDEDYKACKANSYVSHKVGSRGLIDVVPAIGTATLDTPQNMIAKLSRAFLEKPTPKDGPMPVRDQLKQFVDHMAGTGQYDAILVDARAGLSEFSASTLFGLGASVMVFGINQRQTFQDMTFLLAHLDGLKPREGGVEVDWRKQFHFVEAKADRREDGSQFRIALYNILSENLYEQDEGNDPFTFSVQTEGAPHQAARILHDEEYLRFDPVADIEVLKPNLFEKSYAEFLQRARNILERDAGT